MASLLVPKSFDSKEEEDEFYKSYLEHIRKQKEFEEYTERIYEDADWASDQKDTLNLEKVFSKATDQKQTQLEAMIKLLQQTQNTADIKSALENVATKSEIAELMSKLTPNEERDKKLREQRREDIDKAIDKMSERLNIDGVRRDIQRLFLQFPDLTINPVLADTAEESRAHRLDKSGFIYHIDSNNKDPNQDQFNLVATYNNLLDEVNQRLKRMNISRTERGQVMSNLLSTSRAKKEDEALDRNEMINEIKAMWNELNRGLVKPFDDNITIKWKDKTLTQKIDQRKIDSTISTEKPASNDKIARVYEALRSKVRPNEMSGSELDDSKLEEKSAAPSMSSSMGRTTNDSGARSQTQSVPVVEGKSAGLRLGRGLEQAHLVQEMMKLLGQQRLGNTNAKNRKELRLLKKIV